MVVSKELLSAVLNKAVYDIHIGDRLVTYVYDTDNGSVNKSINIHELAFLTREYFKKHGRHLTLNQSIEDIFKEANNIYEDLSE